MFSTIYLLFYIIFHIEITATKAHRYAKDQAKSHELTDSDNKQSALDHIRSPPPALLLPSSCSPPALYANCVGLSLISLSL